MSLEALDTVAARLAEYAEEEGIARLNLFWQGGEVMLLGTDRVRRGHAIWQTHLEAAGIEVTHRLQTNLLLLDDEWLRVVGELFGGRLSTSFDYPNAFRMERGSTPADYTARWLANLHRARDAGYRCGIICIPNSGTVAAGAQEVCRFFYEEAGPHGFQVNLPFPSRAWGDGRKKVELVHVHVLARFMCDLYDEWERRWAAHGRHLQPLTRLKEYFSGGGRRLPCVWSRDCSRDFISIGPEGEVGLCDCWVLSYPEFNFGNLLHQPLAEILESPHRARLGRRLSQLASSQCGECADLENCFGGCPIRTYTREGTLETVDPYCPLYRELFAHIGRRVGSTGEMETDG